MAKQGCENGFLILYMVAKSSAIICAALFYISNKDIAKLEAEFFANEIKRFSLIACEFLPADQVFLSSIKSFNEWTQQKRLNY